MAFECVQHAIEGRWNALAAPVRLAGAALGFLLLQVCGVQQHHPGQLPAGWRGDDLALEAAPDQQRDTPAVVQVRMGQQQDVDGLRVEAEIGGVLLVDLASALEQAAVHQDAQPADLHQVAGAGHCPVRAVERQPHVFSSSGSTSPCSSNNSLPLTRCHWRMPFQASAAVSAYQNSSMSSASMLPTSNR